MRRSDLELAQETVAEEMETLGTGSLLLRFDGRLGRLGGGRLGSLRRKRRRRNHRWLRPLRRNGPFRSFLRHRLLRNVPVCQWERKLTLFHTRHLLGLGVVGSGDHEVAELVLPLPNHVESVRDRRELEVDVALIYSLRDHALHVEVAVVETGERLRFVCRGRNRRRVPELARGTSNRAPRTQAPLHGKTNSLIQCPPT